MPIKSSINIYNTYMKNPKFINGPTQLQLSQHTTIAFSIKSLESSIHNLLKVWTRREKWMFLFSTTEQNLNRSPWRTNLDNFLESARVHVVAISLLLLDLAMTILELSSSLLSCTPNKKMVGFQVWYHWVGIAILGVLLAKTVALAVGMGSPFLRRPSYVIDVGILVGAIILETFPEGKGGGLIMVVSLWRVVRLVESALELSDEAIEAQIEGILCMFETLQEENMRLSETIIEKDKIIEKLQNDMDHCCRDGCYNSTP